MFYQIIAHLDKKFNFATVSAHSDSAEKNALLTGRVEQTQASSCSSFLEEPLNFSGSACDGGIF
ncbi:hypothetical protein [Thalassomonas actiniarum]|uniref:Uncharacterized protein n=1 Tax=Thalassomonas actiniarum TaxID=485447 RepID=A0AAE9YL69_9GAMM|nr:hypothetical protein [Thalassomonas actiniarum]WDD97564.1 hypothetical protein SG35_019905 [Thalassomonas actiniarum]